ncbi:acyl-CoA carboxylase subunit epsilon [Streptomyces sp. NPDC102402]|uniref:acyl-CoA carboxylase subunit epsilon n=1 Tax=Streptomyces sp. NPDC102402 TaxID=3366169 RepID=UPI00382992DF
MTGPVQDPAGPVAVPDADASALALAASIRIVRGSPTAEEVATLAALLIARIRFQQEVRPVPRAPVPRAPVRRLRREPSFIAPGAWAS